MVQPRVPGPGGWGWGGGGGGGGTRSVRTWYNLGSLGGGGGDKVGAHVVQPRVPGLPPPECSEGATKGTGVINFIG